MTRRGDSLLPVLTFRFVVLAAVSSFVALILPIDSLLWSLVALNGGLSLLAALDARSAPRPSSVEVRRDMPEVVAMNATERLRWAVVNPIGRPLTVSIADELPPSFRFAARRFHLRVPSSGRSVVETTVRPSRRGKFTVSKITVRTIGRLGLAGRIGTRLQPATLRVYPPFGSRKEAELRIERARVLEVGMRSVRSRGGGTEFEQLREYGIDDDFRRIDWAATARSNKAIVRTYRAEQNQNLMILLDTGRLMAAKVDEVTRLEHAIDTVLAVSTVASRLGDRVGLIAFDDEVRAEVALSQGPTHIGRITDAVYDLQPRLVESDYRRAFTTMLTRVRRRCMVLLLTETGDHAIDETLLPSLSVITRNNLLFVAGVCDPDVDGWARATPTETERAYQKAAAVASLHDRRRNASRLRATGGNVIDATPGKLASAAADAYLEVKAAGRL